MAVQTYCNPIIKTRHRVSERLNRFSLRLMQAGLVLADALGLLATVWLAIELRVLIFGARPMMLYEWLPIVIVGFLALFAAVRLYAPVGLGVVEETRQIVVTTSTFFFILITFAYFIRQYFEISRFFLVAAWLLALIFIPVMRALARGVMAHLGLWGLPTAVIGPVGQVEDVVDFLEKYPKTGLRPTVVYINEPDCLPDCLGAACSSKAQLRRQAEENHIHTAIVICNDLEALEPLRDAFEDTFERLIIANGLDVNNRLSGVTVRDYGRLMGMEIQHNLLNPIAQYTKRLIDIVGSVFLLTILAPVFLILTAVIFFDSPGRILYRQKRLGKNGKAFTFIKFRTMQLNADEYLQKYLADHPMQKAEWERYQKLQIDPRITRVGRLLRRFSLDELPQLWNVLIGEMSLVGPRPIMLNQRKMYGKTISRYEKVRPGMTGLWQVSGRNRTTFDERAVYDSRYVTEWSVWLDIYIIWRTVWTVLDYNGTT